MEKKRPEKDSPIGKYTGVPVLTKKQLEEWADYIANPDGSVRPNPKKKAPAQKEKK